MIDLLRDVLTWVAANPYWTLAVVFLCCVGESIVVLGVLIPTTLVLLVTGALVGFGSLGLWPAIGAAVAGAVAGDSINFWAGRSWGNRALESHYALRYQDAIARSRGLFERHGAKALVIARFIGLVRPFVAAIAGAYRMSVPRFLVVEVLASLLWAGPLVVLGVVFGASLDLAAEVAARLALLILVVFIGLVLLLWLVNVAVGGLGRHAGGWVAALLDWSNRHRRLGRLGQWLADPAQPETPALAMLALALFALGWLWMWLWWGLDKAPAVFDMLTWQGAQDLRTPITTGLALAIAQLADWQVYVPVAVVVGVTLLLLRRPRAAAHWLAAVAFGTALSLGLYWLVDVPDPVNYSRGIATVRFGGRDLVLATVIYGFLPVMLATHRSQAMRTVYYGAAASLIVLMLAVDVYRGAMWLSTGVFSVVFGALWVTLLGVGYRRHGAEPIPAREVLPLAAGVLIAAAALSSSTELRREYEAQADATRTVPAAAWWRERYAELPAYRVDAAGHAKQPLSVQWRGELPRIQAALRADGWDAPLPLTWENALRWLAVDAPITELPVLPQVHAGAHQALVLRKGRGHGEQWLIRLWPSGIYAGGVPVWVGTLTVQTSRGALRLVRYPQTEPEYDSPLQALGGALPGFEARRARHPARDAGDAAWSGGLWLLRPA
ncbi:MAG: VTT domain-containing protein [Gammaproteobacteria bacterium]